MPAPGAPHSLSARPLALAALVIAGCGGGQTRGTPFDPAWIDDHGAAMAEFVASFQHARVLIGADVAVGVIGRRSLVGVPLAGGRAWTFDHELHGRPALAGSVVVAAGGGQLFALDALTGKLLWSRPTGGRIRGAGDDGATTVVSLLPTIGSGSLILAIARDGSVVRQLEDDREIGVPAVVGDAVFFPWGGRFLSVYDLPSGDERARIALPGKTSRVFAQGGALFAGEASFTRIDERLALAEKSTVTLPALPGDPVWSRPGTDWVLREADAIDREGLYARPAARGPAVIEGGRLVITHGRMARGRDARTGAALWAHEHEADFIGGAAYHGGFALCDTRGEITFLDAETGRVAGSVSLGRPVDACLVQADALSLRG